jgi:hypothetical protein
MEPDHGKWRELILSHEALSPKRRELADNHLATCASCRKLLAHIRTLERSSGPAGSLPPVEAGAEPWASPREEELAAASLSALRDRLGLDGGKASRPRDLAGRPLRREASQGWRRSLRFRLVPAAAAVAAALLIIWSPWRNERTPPSPIRRLEILSHAGARGAPGAATVWHRGDAFGLRFVLDRSAYPVVLHLDATGSLALLHPENPAAPVSRYAAASPVELPPPESPQEWVFEGAAGRQTLFVAAGTRPDIELGAILSELQASSSVNPAVRAETLARLIETRIGRVATLDVSVLP